MFFNLSRKEAVYLILPVILLLVAFPTILISNQTLITNPTDAFLSVNSDLSVIKNPFSLWNNQWLNGLPEYANPLSARYYPFYYPLFLLIQDPFVITFTLFIHLYIAYLCFFKLSGLMTKNLELRMMASLFYLFSGVLLSRVFAGHILLVYALAWIPLLYYGFFKIVWDDEVTVKNIGIIAVSLALIFFTGAIYYLFYCCLILLVFFTYYLVKRMLRKSALFALFGAFTIGALILSIKAIPVILVSDALGRIDIINPLGDGGSLESNLASIIFGTGIDQTFGFYESAVLIGALPLLLVILALVFDREDRTIPAFFAIVIAFIWADGGNTLLSFIHLLPGLTNFRCAGRVFGALLPIILLFAICGVELLNTHIRKGESFLPTPRQKRNILIGLGILALVKLCELPFQTSFTVESILSVLIVGGFIGFIYFTTQRRFFVFLIPLCVIELIVIANRIYLTASFDMLLKMFVIIAIILSFIIFFNKERFSLPLKGTNYIYIFLLISLGIVIIGNMSYLPTSDPKLNDSPAIAIIDRIPPVTLNGHQNWVFETGWSIKHMDFTYWFLKNGIHPVRAYYPYYLKSEISPVYAIGGVSYYTSDYIVDTQYLENGQQNIPYVTFKVNNISVYKPENVLPNAFIVRNDDHLVPVTIERLFPDEVTIYGQFLSGDIAVLKTSFYPGWKVNGQESVNIGNMVTYRIKTNTNKITFRFDPFDIKIAALLSGIGAVLLGVLFFKSSVIDEKLKKKRRKKS